MQHGRERTQQYITPSIATGADGAARERPRAAPTPGPPGPSLSPPRGAGAALPTPGTTTHPWAPGAAQDPPSASRVNKKQLCCCLGSAYNHTVHFSISVM